MTSTVELLELKDNINDVADFCQPDEFLDIFNFDRYYTDTGMDMSYEEFCSHLEPFDEEDVQPVKEASPDLDQPSTPDVLDPTMKVPSDLSAETPSKLSVPICMIAIGTVDNDGVCESEPLPNLLKAPISGVLDGTSSKSSTALLGKKRKHCEASITASESQDNVLPTGRCTRRKTSFRKHLSDENVFLVSSVEDIEKLLENRQEMALAENTRVGLIELKNKFLAWGVHDQRVTEEWEEVTNWY